MNARTWISLSLSCLLAASAGTLACSRSESPLSPSTGGTPAGQIAGAGQAIGVTGIVGALNPSAHTFTVAWRGGSRLVLADAETVVWSQRSNSRVRFAALQDGQQVAIRGLDQGRYVLARSIVIEH